MKLSTRISLAVRVIISSLSLALTVVAAVYMAHERSVIGAGLIIYGIIGTFTPIISAIVCLRCDEPATWITWVIDGMAACAPAMIIAILGGILWTDSPTYARIGTIISAVVILVPIVTFICMVIFVMCSGISVWCNETYHIVMDREFPNEAATPMLDEPNEPIIISCTRKKYSI